ncbi:CheR family methyltransferase [Sphingomonas carotinifaciens]|uniref:CheR family methyltransferase n=1 Tax=Sphingomonas carotinifaciens TaxID=1166323 RepID=UPI0019686513|nr:CheR family methyltransferase [Sphingomonas carotinifaciens]
MARDMQDGGTPSAIVGIGVGTASLASLKALFGGIAGSAAGEAAYLVAVRQQDGSDVAVVVEALRAAAPLPVALACDGERIAPGHVYVGGHDDMVTIADGHLAVRVASEPVGHRGTIDTMLISLAEQVHERGIAVILSGLGTDGSAGVTATKKCGGLSIAEWMDDGDAPTVDGGGPYGVTDIRVPAAEMAGQIERYIANLAAPGAEESEQAPDNAEAQVTQITTILRNVTGNDFHDYKRGTFQRRVHRRMLVTQVDSIDAYVARLREDHDEVQGLFQDLLIGVTQFFRDPAEFAVLEGEIPRLFQNKAPGGQLRVWVLGCATGEEAYSIAILLREHMATLARPPEVQIFATDLDARALNLARAGRYTAAIAGHIRPDRLERWFVREGDTYCVAKELREMCIFSPHNIVKDAPFSRIDILSCRNLLIYLNAELQGRVIPIFHFSLQPGGVLFLGSSESVSRHQKLFTPVDRRNRVYRRLETGLRTIPDFPLSARVRTPDMQFAPAAARSPAGQLASAVSRKAEALAERYAPAYVVVDQQFDVLHFSGRTGRYLEPSTGAATLNLLSLIHRDLRLDLRSALSRASSESRRIELPRLTIHQEDRAHAVNLIVEPVGGPDAQALMVLFQDVGPVALPEDGDGDRLATDEHVQRLDAELRVTRDRLQATIEELESTNEELKSSNEEYQSINEELQSANEELETSKEEQQSINEELQTLNHELGHRVGELGQTNSDLKNLLESTQIATVFLDNGLRVRSFTPIATEIFHLLDTDVGRPLDHVVSRVHYPELPDDVRHVLKTLQPVEREVIEPGTSRHFAARVLPYRSTDNFISGAVVTFTDLTAVRQAETASRASEERYRAFVTASSDAVFRMNADWSAMRQMDGRGFLADTNSASHDWMDSYIPPDDQPWMRVAIDDAIQTKAMFELEHRIRRADDTMGWAHSRAVPILDGEGEIAEWIGTASDVTDEHGVEVDRRAGEERLRSAIQVARVGTWDWNIVSDDIIWSEEYFRMLGYRIGEVTPSRDALLGRIHPEDREATEDAIAHARDTQQEYVHEFRSLHPDGSVHWLSARGRFLYAEDGEPLRMIGAMIETTEARELQKRQAVLVTELQHRTRNLIAVVRSMTDKTLRHAPDLQTFRGQFRVRLDALARVQGLLSRLDEHDRVTFDELLRTELAAHGAMENEPDRVTLTGPSGIRMRSGMVQTLAMALHELATNATKYGALKESGGRLAISWRLLDEGDRPKRLEITWQEHGVAMPPADAPPQGSGQGRELIERALPYQLDAETSYAFGPDGVRCVIIAPISRTTA